MTKADLVLEVQKALGKETSKAAAERSVEAVIASILKGIKKDKSVQLIGFGTFTVKQRAAREGVNPQTGAKIKIKASKTVGFKASKSLKDMVQK
ncbi:MAG: DNA-binding protein [Verrucomicrobia bacterium 21-51-4]|nr:MAG: DNA-binding protein [Verrucomicrobia bacterium 21-51-4]HQU09001.1 HU family DNA-binding protein [Opitutales bacterium]